MSLPETDYAAQNAAAHLEDILCLYELTGHDPSRSIHNLSDPAIAFATSQGWDLGPDGADTLQDNIAQCCHEQPLDIRYTWSCKAGDVPEPHNPDGFDILLSTGGPELRITGQLDEGCAYSAVMEHRDWAKPWQSVPTSNDQDDALRWFAEMLCVL